MCRMTKRMRILFTIHNAMQHLSADFWFQSAVQFTCERIEWCLVNISPHGPAMWMDWNPATNKKFLPIQTIIELSTAKLMFAICLRMHHAARNPAAKANVLIMHLISMRCFILCIDVSVTLVCLAGWIDFQFSIVAALRSVGSLTFSRYLTWFESMYFNLIYAIKWDIDPVVCGTRTQALTSHHWSVINFTIIKIKCEGSEGENETRKTVTQNIIVKIKCTICCCSCCWCRCYSGVWQFNRQYQAP